jgi:hypothetical protein
MRSGLTLDDNTDTMREDRQDDKYDHEGREDHEDDGHDNGDRLTRRGCASERSVHGHILGTPLPNASNLIRNPAGEGCTILRSIREHLVRSEGVGGEIDAFQVICSTPKGPREAGERPFVTPFALYFRLTICAVNIQF